MKAIIEEAWAIALRDWRKRSKILKLLLAVGIIGSLIFVIGLGFDRIVSKTAYGGSYSSFFSFGFLVYFIFFTGFATGSDIILDRAHFIRLLLVAPVSKYSILLGKTLSIISGSIKFFFLLGIFFLVTNKEFAFIKLFIILAYCVFLVIISIATSLFLSTLSRDKKISEALMVGFNFLLLFFSGVLFPISSLPEKFQIVFSINPLIYIIDLFRFFMIGANEFPIATDIMVSLVFGFSVIVLGVYQFDRNLRK